MKNKTLEDALGLSRTGVLDALGGLPVESSLHASRWLHDAPVGEGLHLNPQAPFISPRPRDCKYRQMAQHAKYPKRRDRGGMHMRANLGRNPQRENAM